MKTVQWTWRRENHGASVKGSEVGARTAEAEGKPHETDMTVAH